MVVSTHRLPVIITLILLLIGGWLLLDRAAAQARDTTRKHHLDDLEHALYFARNLHGTYPPYDAPSWCGLLNHADNTAVRAQVEQALRAQHEKYKNPDKPFPHDPLYLDKDWDYFYWKRSPASFELYAFLEEDKTGDRRTIECPTSPSLHYDYGITSVWRTS